MTLPGLGDLGLLLLFVGAVWFSPGIADDPGVGWHLRTGQWISENQQIPITDPFLATSGTKAWVSNQWLSDLTFWKCFSWGSWPLLHMVTVILLLIPFVVLSATARREEIGGVALFLSLVLCGMVSTVQWILRPVVISFLIFTALYALLRRYERAAALDWVVLLALLPLFTVWANLHPGFPMGFLLIACCIVGLLWAGRVRHATSLGLSSIFALAATLINPYDVGLLKNILALVGNVYFMALNMEWYSPDFLSAARFPVLLVLAILMLHPPREFSRSELLTVGLFFFMSLMSVRYLPFLAFVSVLPLARSLRESAFLGRLPLKGGSTWGYTGLVMVALLIVVAAKGSIPGLAASASRPGVIYPQEAITAILSEPDPGTVFLSPDWGGFLTFHAWPKKLAFIDDRNELSGQELYENYFQIVQARGDWKRLLDTLDVQWMLLSATDIVAVALAKEPGWVLVSESSVYKLFRRRVS